MTSSTTVVGNLTNDPDLNYGQSGKARSSFGIAVNHSRRNGDSFEEVGTTFLRVTLWDYHAEQAAEHLRKGDRVIATGHFVSRAYKDRDGTEATSFELHVNNIGKAIPKRAPQGQQSQAQGYGGGQSQNDPWGATQPQQGGWETPAERPPF